MFPFYYENFKFSKHRSLFCFTQLEMVCTTVCTICLCNLYIIYIYYVRNHVLPQCTMYMYIMLNLQFYRVIRVIFRVTRRPPFWRIVLLFNRRPPVLLLSSFQKIVLLNPLFYDIYKKLKKKLLIQLFFLELSCEQNTKNIKR